MGRISVESGTLRVASEGLRILFDRVGVLAALLRAADPGA